MEGIMKNKNKMIQLILISMIGISLVACGSADKGMTSDMTASSEVMSAVEAPAEMVNYDYTEAKTEEGEEAPAANTNGNEADVTENVSSNRKLIRNVNLTVETEKFDGLMGNLETKINELGGYVENSDIYNGSYYSEYDMGERSANLTVRIPADKLDDFINQVSSQANITNKSETVEDVTLQYVDLESHKKALSKEQDRLYELLEKAETMEDILKIEEKLADVRYQLESMESQIRTFDNQITYSTVYLCINEVTRISPQAPKNVGERITSGLSETFYNIGTGFIDFFVWFVVNLPILLIWAVIIIVIIIIVMKVKKKKAIKKSLNENKKDDIKKESQNYSYDAGNKTEEEEK